MVYEDEYNCNNFVYSQSIFKLFLSHIHYRNFETGRCILMPHNTVYVTTLPCKKLNHNFTKQNRLNRLDIIKGNIFCYSCKCNGKVTFVRESL